MRLAWLALVVAACGTGGRGTDNTWSPLPDAGGCGVGAFDIVAPVTGEHYDTNLAALIDFAELDPDLGDVTLSMVDDAGTSYAPLSDTQEETSPDAPPFYRWRFDYALAPARRYELTVTPTLGPVCVSSIASVTFFTSP